METHGGGGVEKLDSQNLRDFLRIKQDNYQDNHDRFTAVSVGRNNLTGMTLDALLSEERAQIRPGNETPQRLHSNRTLLDIIRDEPGGAARRDSQRKWRNFKNKLRLRRNDSRSAWTPGISSASEILTNNHINNRILIEPEEGGGEEEEGPQPVRMSLMALLAETDRKMGIEGASYMIDEEEEVAESGGGVEYNNCCVCMVRKKGSAFIPCGHTFCRLCSRELWVQRGNCPICNNIIVEILDIF